jgi:hypothetical protein
MAKVTTSRVRALAVLLLASVALSAGASPSLILSDGVNTVTVADGSALDTNAAAGVVTYETDPLDPATFLGLWTVNVTTGTTVAATPPHLALDSVNVSQGAGSLDIFLSDIDFTFGPDAGLFGLLASISGSTNGALAWELWVDDANAAFAMTTLVASGGPVIASFFDIFTDIVPLDGAFSMTLHVHLTHPGGSDRTTSFTFAAEASEPATPALMGLALLALAVWFRHSRT